MMNIKSYTSITILPIFALLLGCQQTPNYSTKEVNLTSNIPATSLLEISYLCASNTNEKGLLVSAFYSQNSQPSSSSQSSKELIIRLKDNNYSMTQLDKYHYISQKPTSNGHWLLWQIDPTTAQNKQTITSPTSMILSFSNSADGKQIINQQVCQVTR